MSYSAAKKAWTAANQDRVRISRKRWREKNKAKIAANMRRWRAENAEHYRAWVVANQPKIRARAEATRKSVSGRVCRDCGRSDAETTWSSVKSQCGACRAREGYNGRCARCGSIRVRVVSVRGPAAKGKQGRRACPENCYRPSGLGPRGESALVLWDVLWTSDTSAEWFRLDWRDVARVTGAKEKTARRHATRLNGWVRKLGVRHELERGEDGVLYLAFDPRALREVLRPMVDKLAGVA